MSHSAKKGLMLAAPVFLAVLAFVLVNVFDTGLKATGAEAADSEGEEMVKEKVLRFQSYLKEVVAFRFNDQNQVLVVIPVRGCEGSVEWSVDFLESVEGPFVSSLIVSPGQVARDNHAVLKDLNADYNDLKQQIKSYNIYPNFPMVAFIEGKTVTRVLNINCGTMTGLEGSVNDFLSVNHSATIR